MQPKNSPPKADSLTDRQVRKMQISIKSHQQSVPRQRFMPRWGSHSHTYLTAFLGTLIKLFRIQDSYPFSGYNNRIEPILSDCPLSPVGKLTALNDTRIRRNLVHQRYLQKILSGSIYNGKLTQASGIMN